MKKKEIMSSVATWRNREIIIIGETSQIEGDKYHDITSYVESKKMMQMNLFTKQKQLTDLENKLRAPKGKGGEG